MKFKKEQDVHCGDCAMQQHDRGKHYCRAFGRELSPAPKKNLPVKRLWVTIIERCEECKNG